MSLKTIAENTKIQEQINTDKNYSDFEHLDHWGNQRKYTANEVHKINDTYTGWLKTGKDCCFYEALIEEHEEGHPEKWLNSVIFELTKNKESELAKKIKGYDFFKKRENLKAQLKTS